MNIVIKKAGMLTTIQDEGRIGYADVGFATSGAGDIDAMHIANWLVGNDGREAVIECILLGASMLFNSACVIAVTGADMEPKLNGFRIPINTTIAVPTGGLLELGLAKTGCRCYIAVSSGMVIPAAFGSKSTNIKCSIGGFEGRPLRVNDCIPIVNQKVVKNTFKCCPNFDINIPDEITTLHVVNGPQAEYFTKQGIYTFYSGEYKITEDSDRMAYRTTGDKIEIKGKADIISDGIALGSVQVSSSGLPMIMLHDRQTIGGYTKIATVITSDISKLVQCKPGNKIRFKEIDITTAQKIAKEKYYRLMNLKERLSE